MTLSALSLIETSIATGHQVIGIFFYQDGVLNCSKHLALPNDENQITSRWVQLTQQRQIPLYLCISAAERRGLTDDVDLDLPEIANTYSNIETTVIVSGLGELIELTSKASRVIQL